ncbi:polyprenyl synthetase family protein [Nonomuraea sp. NPDC049624]|uniref:polyprenyl synthetase family protein n=1 Tax=Nonomuraea sp. NPDC049624 TaxID=3154354 RepID=UPI00343ABEC9
MHTKHVNGTQPTGNIISELGHRWSDGGDSLDAICRYALMPAGKLFRPMLMVESALAVGGTIAHVLPAAVGSEYGHTASLIHDDIIDCDELRRGRPSVFSRYGIEDAIVAGDALIFHLFLCLAECRRAGAPAERVVRALEIAATAGLDMCRGQHLESEITKNSIRDRDRYLRMVDLKSAALFRSACQCGVVLGGGLEASVRSMGGYGTGLGVAFQIIDDLFAFTDDGSVTGKHPASDVRNRRLTLPLILVYESADPVAVRLLDDAFSGELGDQEALAAATKAVERTGVLDICRKVALEHITSAKDELLLLPDTPSRDRLGQLADDAVERVR